MHYICECTPCMHYPIHKSNQIWIPIFWILHNLTYCFSMAEGTNVTLLIIGDNDQKLWIAPIITLDHFQVITQVCQKMSLGSFCCGGTVWQNRAALVFTTGSRIQKYCVFYIIFIYKLFIFALILANLPRMGCVYLQHYDKFLCLFTIYMFYLFVLW